MVQVHCGTHCIARSRSWSPISHLGLGSMFTPQLIVGRACSCLAEVYMYMLCAGVTLVEPGWHGVAACLLSSSPVVAAELLLALLAMQTAMHWHGAVVGTSAYPGLRSCKVAYAVGSAAGHRKHMHALWWDGKPPRGGLCSKSHGQRLSLSCLLACVSCLSRRLQL
jgi:hypothetical protein